MDGYDEEYGPDEGCQEEYENCIFDTMEIPFGLARASWLELFLGRYYRDLPLISRQ